MATLPRRRALLAPLPLLGACASPAPRPPARRKSLELVDLMPGFWAYVEEGRAASPARRRALFRAKVMAPHPEVFIATVVGRDVLDEAAWDSALDRFWERWQPLLPLMRTHGATLRATLQQAESAFVRELPDFDVEERVYLMPSFLAFDGATRKVGGREVMLFGLDMMSAIHPASRDLRPLVFHELFHRYHTRRLPEGMEGTFLRMMWTEGLATYASARLVPGATTRDVLLQDSLAQVSASDLARLAAEARPRLGRRLSDEDDALFFAYNGGVPAAEGFPSRGGYLVGYEAARRLGRETPLAALARLPRPEIQAKVDAALGAIAAGV